MRQLGNAVPVELGEAVGHWMAGMLKAPTVLQAA
jgi:hypothetical protein